MTHEGAAMKVSIFRLDSSRGALIGGLLGNQAKVSRSKWDRVRAFASFLASVLLPEPEFPKMIILACLFMKSRSERRKM